MQNESASEDDLPELIAGSRITLQRPRPGDGALLQQALNEPGCSFWRSSQHGPMNAAFAEATVLRTLVAFLARRQVYYNLWRNADRYFVGQVGFDEIDWQARSAHIGYWLRASVGRQGLMSQAVGLLCNVAFETLSLTRAVILADRSNDRSVALARRLHFVRQEDLVRTSLPNGERDYAIVYALTREEYLERAADIRALLN
jgi:RimJ/RimL family protein N-acetyltransferase